MQAQSVISKVLGTLGSVSVGLQLSGLLGNIPSAYLGEGRGQEQSRGGNELNAGLYPGALLFLLPECGGREKAPLSSPTTGAYTAWWPSRSP